MNLFISLMIVLMMSDLLTKIKIVIKPFELANTLKKKMHYFQECYEPKFTAN